MESTLPGREWIQTTFPGVIDITKIVIYNDATNRKEIVEEEYQLWKNIDGGALYEVTLNNNGTKEVLKYMISLGD